MNSRAFISFLDVAACGMGASILLLLIGVIFQTDKETNASDESVIIRCEQTGGASASIGIEYLSPESGGWKLAERDLLPEEGAFFASPARERNGLFSILILYTPHSGEWKFRPVLLEIPSQGLDTPCRVNMAVSGKGIDQNLESSMVQTGEQGKPISVIVKK